MEGVEKGEGGDMSTLSIHGTKKDPFTELKKVELQNK
jgi:hypothetical protein